MLAAKHCSMLFSTALNSLCDLRCVSDTNTKTDNARKGFSLEKYNKELSKFCMCHLGMERRDGFGCNNQVTSLVIARQHTLPNYLTLSMK